MAYKDYTSPLPLWSGWTGIAQSEHNVSSIATVEGGQIRMDHLHRRMGTLWLGGQRGWFARNFAQITGADTGFPEGGGGGEDIPQAHTPLDIVCVTSSALRKIEKHPPLGHSQAPLPWTLPVVRHPHSKGGTKLLKGGTKLLKGGTKSWGWATGGGGGLWCAFGSHTMILGYLP